MILKDKTAIITGTSRGIGKSMVEVFAKEGANVWACYRRKDEKLERYFLELSEKYAVRIKPLIFDMENLVEMKEAIKNISVDKDWKVDVLVNNAGITLNSLFQMTTIEQWKKCFNVNVFAVVNLIQMVSKLMIKNKKGSIVNISSVAGIDGNSGRAAYGCSKASIICLTKVLSKEFANFGIRVNAIAPGLIQTEMLESMKKDFIEETLKQTCLKRVGDPNEISNMAVFLASELSSYVTGQTIRVDGGF